MANKFGLHITDETKYLKKEGYPNPEPTPTEDTWVRTGLRCDDKPVTATAIETNKFGLYVKDNQELLLNGSNVADIKDGGTYGAVFKDNGVSIGDTVVSRPSGVINITLDNYNALRSGHRIDGYARYNDRAVYNIVADVATAPNDIEFEAPDGIYDIVYNSYVNNWEDNPLENKTILDVNTPALDIRHVDQYGKEGGGITIEYFVDTKHYDSINNGTIGTKFTVYVIDSYGKTIYSHTTYAGHFRINTDAFTDGGGNNVTGNTWFSIQCVDEEGRGSCEYFFSVHIKASDYLERLYPMTKTDLDYYKITPNRNDPIVSYRNRLGFARLINDVKNGVKGNYNGIKFFNPNVNKDDITNASNYTYYINLYPDRTYRNTDKNLSNNDYKTRDDSAFNLVSQDYYIFKYHAGSATDPARLDSMDIKAAGANAFTPCGFEDNSATNWSELTHSNIEAFKIEPGKTFMINGNPVTVPDSCNTHEGILDWIWEDGAGICRDADDNIIRHQSGPSDYDSENETYVEDYRNVHCLRVISVNNEKWKATLYKHNASYSDQVTPGNPRSDDPRDPAFYPFKAGEGYYYVSFYNGFAATGTTEWQYGMIELPVLDDFTIDFNYTSWRVHDALLLAKRANLLELSLCNNVEVRNGWIKGAYDGTDTDDPEGHIHQLTKRGYLAQNSTNMAPWEAGGSVNVIAGRFAKFTNMRVTGSLGYDIMAHCPSSSDYADYVVLSEVRDGKRVPLSPIETFVDIAGYVNPVDGTLTTDSTCIVKEDNDEDNEEDNESLLPETSFDYDAEESTDICLAVTSEYINITNVVATGFKEHLTNTITSNHNASNSRVFDDEFVIGHWSNRNSVKYPELFVHFYNSNDEHLRTVKTRINCRIKKLRGASKIKVTMYLTGTLNGTTPVVYLPTNVEKRLERYTTRFCGITENVIYDHCFLGMSASSMIEATAINMELNDCELVNVNYTPYGLSTPHQYPISAEEHSGCQMLFNINNTKIYAKPYSKSGNDQHMISSPNYAIRWANGGMFMNIINSVGFTAWYNIMGCYIANSWLNRISPTIGPGINPNAQWIVKHSIGGGGIWTVDRTFNADQLTYLTTGGGKVTCSASEDTINTNISLEDCFFNKSIFTRTNSCLVKGNQWHCGEYAVDAYYHSYITIKELWDNRTEDNRDKDHGWVHFVVYAPYDGYRVPIGCKGIGSVVVKENNKTIVYIDGIKTLQSLPELRLVNNADTSRIETCYTVAIPTKGHHVVSYQLNGTHFPSYSGIVLIPYGVLLTEFPANINETVKFADIFKATNGETSYLRCVNFNQDIRPTCPIILNGDEGCRIGGTGGTYSFEVYVPVGGKELYMGFLDKYGNPIWGANKFVEGEEFDLHRLI